jgi:hypothetical protein
MIEFTLAELIGLAKFYDASPENVYVYKTYSETQVFLITGSGKRIFLPAEKVRTIRELDSSRLESLWHTLKLTKLLQMDANDKAYVEALAGFLNGSGYFYQVESSSDRENFVIKIVE